MSDIVSELQKKDSLNSYKSKKIEADKIAVYYSYSEKKHQKSLIVRSRSGVKLGSIFLPSIKGTLQF